MTSTEPPRGGPVTVLSQRIERLARAFHALQEDDSSSPASDANSGRPPTQPTTVTATTTTNDSGHGRNNSSSTSTRRNDIYSSGRAVRDDRITSGSRECFALPGLYVDGLGLIGLPLGAKQARALVGQCRSLDGRDGQHTWALPPGLFDLQNPKWPGAVVHAVLDELRGPLRLPETTAVAEIAYLIVSDPGGAAYEYEGLVQDKERICGSLIFSLPSWFEGGGVSFDPHERPLRPANAQEPLVVTEDHHRQLAPLGVTDFGLRYVGVSGQCVWRLHPITAGYRLCIVYSILRQRTSTPTTPGASTPSPARSQSQSATVATTAAPPRPISAATTTTTSSLRQEPELEVESNSQSPLAARMDNALAALREYFSPSTVGVGAVESDGRPMHLAVLVRVSMDRLLQELQVEPTRRELTVLRQFCQAQPHYRLYVATAFAHCPRRVNLQHPWLRLGRGSTPKPITFYADYAMLGTSAVFAANENTSAPFTGTAFVLFGRARHLQRELQGDVRLASPHLMRHLAADDIANAKQVALGIVSRKHEWSTTSDTFDRILQLARTTQSKVLLIKGLWSVTTVGYCPRIWPTILALGGWPVLKEELLGWLTRLRAVEAKINAVCSMVPLEDSTSTHADARRRFQEMLQQTFPPNPPDVHPRSGLFTSDNLSPEQFARFLRLVHAYSPSDLRRLVLGSDIDLSTIVLPAFVSFLRALTPTERTPALRQLACRLRDHPGICRSSPLSGFAIAPEASHACACSDCEELRRFLRLDTIREWTAPVRSITQQIRLAHLELACRTLAPGKLDGPHVVTRAYQMIVVRKLAPGEGAEGSIAAPTDPIADLAALIDEDESTDEEDYGIIKIEDSDDD